jgi:bifunctional oligoribonuclease and PAP phosphatase NrnA
LKKIAQNIINDINSLIINKKNIVIIPHQNPDGDAIGSVLGLFHFFTAKGKSATVISPNNFPDFLKWMPGANDILIFTKNQKHAKKLIQNAELFVFGDFNSLSRIKNLEKSILQNDAPKILIDHHPYPDDFANFTISDTSVSSTAELVFEFILSLNSINEIDKNIAECLYAGILTDTGNFSYNSSNPRTFEIAAELLKKKINKDHIFKNIYDNYALSRWKLLGYCLYEKMNILHEFKVGYISISKQELEDFDFVPGDTEGFVNYPLSVKGIVVSALFIEKNDIIKISFRSKGEYAVNELAKQYFNGGGHKNAAGGEIELSLNEAIEKFISVLPNFFEIDE